MSGTIAAVTVGGQHAHGIRPASSGSSSGGGGGSASTATLELTEGNWSAPPAITGAAGVFRQLYWYTAIGDHDLWTPAFDATGLQLNRGVSHFTWQGPAALLSLRGFATMSGEMAAGTTPQIADISIDINGTRTAAFPVAYGPGTTPDVVAETYGVYRYDSEEGIGMGGRGGFAIANGDTIGVAVVFRERAEGGSDATMTVLGRLGTRVTLTAVW